MFCTACGSEISLAAAVCPSCGRPVATADIRVTPGPDVAVASQSGAWAPPVVAQAALAPSHPAPGSIYAGDLDAPGFPRDLSGRVALLTGLVMTADLLLPWITINGDAYAPTRLGLPALALVAALVAVIAPPLIPRLRHAPLTRALPFGVGAFSFGVAVALWLLAGPLASALTAALATRFANADSSGGSDVVGSQAGSLLHVAPGIGLYLFLLGACVLLVAGYQTLAARSAH